MLTPLVMAALLSFQSEPAPMPQPADPLVLPATVIVPKGGLIRILATGTAATIKWRIPPGIQYDTCEQGRKIVGTAPPGKYEIIAVAAKDNEPFLATCILTVEGEAPPPPGPGPTPPGPADPFAADVAKAYQDDQQTDPVKKKLDGNQLIALYETAATMVRSGDFATAGDLIEALRRAAEHLTADALRGVRQRVGQELSKVLPMTPDASLNEQHKQQAADIFGRAATALRTVVK